ncbi:hemerythrin domain-containing protein [Lederbergia panacisoli]|uniref:hemerythrin domain-containing protein n=1 Tax=Lederbergia panacisoli TaxID=1255251 RepID=UPI00214C06DE|nr:hemerythrin domain-containing protein [Lederbergia panacisoli]MCR2821854.1 hemerythrin domain-containing protein [Lederbergia panacisoli]
MAKYGPSLGQKHAHHAIHEGALTGAIQKTEDLLRYLKQGEAEAAKLTADDLIDYWETRIIAHADSEESGFYQEMVEQNPELKEAVIGLKRDHDILRMILQDIRVILKEEGITREVMMKFDSLITVNELHSREEERTLFVEKELFLK